MEREELLKKIKAIVADKLSIGEDQVTEEASFIDDLGADSLDTVELVMALEDEFNLDIPDDEAEKLTTVGKAMDYVLAHEKLPYFCQKPVSQKSSGDRHRTGFSLGDRNRGELAGAFGWAERYCEFQDLR